MLYLSLYESVRNSPVYAVRSLPNIKMCLCLWPLTFHLHLCVRSPVYCPSWIYEASSMHVRAWINDKQVCFSVNILLFAGLLAGQFKCDRNLLIIQIDTRFSLKGHDIL